MLDQTDNRDISTRIVWRHGGWRSRIGACTTNGIRFNGWWVCKGQVFIPVVTGALRSTLRTDIAWGDYRPESLKENTRQKRKTGVRNEVAEHVKMPRNWKSFLGGAGWTRKSCYSSSLLMLADTPSLPTSKKLSYQAMTSTHHTNTWRNMRS